MRLRVIGVSLLAACAAALALAGAGLALDIADGDPPSGTVGVAYSYTFMLSPGSGSPGVTWSISSGALPPGLSLHGNDRTATGSAWATVVVTIRVARPRAVRRLYRMARA